MGSDRLYREVICRLTMSEGRQSQVVLLDDRRLDILIKPKLYAGELLDMVASHFSLKEKEYFGLAYADDTGHYSWLQLDRRVLEHDFPKRSANTTLVLYFRIKYFVESITYLRDSSTVEAFYLQTQSLVYNGLIEVSSEKAFQLAALVLQATHADYSSDTLAKQQLKKLPVLPTSALVDHPSLPLCEERVIEQYISLQGLTRGAAIVNYMRIAESLPTYGLHYYEVKDKAGLPWWLGISCKGICQYDLTDRRVPRKLFLWKQLENLYFRDRKFSIEVYDPKRGVTASRKTFGPGNISVHVWFASSPSLTKCIWSMAISQHQFYLDRKHNKSALSLSVSRQLTDIADELSHGSYSTETSSLGRSVSSLSLPALKLDSDSCDETLDTVEMFVALKARKEALERALRNKCEELKKICVREGELTGALPPEMPLSPGEQIPIVKRKTGGPIKDRLLWKKKTKDEQELAHLELEYEIQTKIVNAALKLLNDSTLKKNLRRQRKLSHQKAVQKLKEIEHKLMHLRKKEYLSKDEAYHSHNDSLIQQSANLKDLSITFSPTEVQNEDAKNSFNKMSSSASSPIPLRVCSVPSSPIAARHPVQPRYSSADQQHNTQGYTPSSVYQTRTDYRSQQYPTFSMKSPTASTVSSGDYFGGIDGPYRNKYESTLDLDGSNIYSVPTQRTSQAFDTQDDLTATVPTTQPQDLGLVSRHNSLDRNRRHSSQKQRRYIDTQQRPTSSAAYDNPVMYQNPYPQTTPHQTHHHPHHYHHHRVRSPTEQQKQQQYQQSNTNMYQQNLKLYAPDSMYNSDKKSFVPQTSSLERPKHWAVSPSGGSDRKWLMSPSSVTPQQVSPSSAKEKKWSGPGSLMSPTAQLVSPSSDRDRNWPGNHTSATSIQVSPSSGADKKWPQVPTSMSVDSFKPHVDVVEYGEYKPYWEETKPYETSDFYKYSTKHRKPTGQNLHAKLLAWKANQTQYVGGPPSAMSPVLERSRTASPALSTSSQQTSTEEAGLPSSQVKKEGCSCPQSSSSSTQEQGGSTSSDAMHNEILDWYSKQEKGKKTTLV